MDQVDSRTPIESAGQVVIRSVPTSKKFTPDRVQTILEEHGPVTQLLSLVIENDPGKLQYLVEFKDPVDAEYLVRMARGELESKCGLDADSLRSYDLRIEELWRLRKKKLWVFCTTNSIGLAGNGKSVYERFVENVRFDAQQVQITQFLGGSRLARSANKGDLIQLRLASGGNFQEEIISSLRLQCSKIGLEVQSKVPIKWVSNLESNSKLWDTLFIDFINVEDFESDSEGKSQQKTRRHSNTQMGSDQNHPQHTICSPCESFPSGNSEELDKHTSCGLSSQATVDTRNSYKGKEKYKKNIEESQQARHQNMLDCDFQKEFNIGIKSELEFNSEELKFSKKEFTVNDIKSEGFGADIVLKSSKKTKKATKTKKPEGETSMDDLERLYNLLQIIKQGNARAPHRSDFWPLSNMLVRLLERQEISLPDTTRRFLESVINQIDEFYRHDGRKGKSSDICVALLKQPFVVNLLWAYLNLEIAELEYERNSLINKKRSSSKKGLEVAQIEFGHALADLENGVGVSHLDESMAIGLVTSGYQYINQMNTHSQRANMNHISVLDLLRTPENSVLHNNIYSNNYVDVKSLKQCYPMNFGFEENVNSNFQGNSIAKGKLKLNSKIFDPNLNSTNNANIHQGESMQNERSSQGLFYDGSFSHCPDNSLHQYSVQPTIFPGENSVYHYYQRKDLLIDDRSSIQQINGSRNCHKKFRPTHLEH